MSVIIIMGSLLLKREQWQKGYQTEILRKKFLKMFSVLTYVVDEAILFDSAWAIALNTGCSGFDSYFISGDKNKKCCIVYR